MPQTTPPRPTYTDDLTTLYVGDSLRVLAALPEDSIHAVVCVPPYAIKATPDPTTTYRTTNGQAAPDLCSLCTKSTPAPDHTACSDCLHDITVRAFKTADMLGQQSANWHEKATHSRGYADNSNAAFHRWVHLWATECLRVLKPGGHLIAFGGTKTWHRLAIGIEDAGFEIRDSLAWLYGTGFPKSVDAPTAIRKHRDKQPHPNTSTPDPADSQWKGWGTALKPAHEPIVLARKPLPHTVGANLDIHGTGAINIDGTRLTDGRWPTNVFLDSHQGLELDRTTDTRPSRFFWVAKPNQRERVRVAGHTHPTVKPIDLMRELVRLVTPPGGTVLDPFAGSGTTIEACILERLHCVGIEKDTNHIPLIQERIRRQTTAFITPVESATEPSLFDLPK